MYIFFLLRNKIVTTHITLNIFLFNYFQEMFTNLTQLNSTNEDYFNDTIDDSFGNPKLECPTYDKTETAILDSLGFWIDTVVTSVLCLVGFIANIFSTLILGR